jgi:hypothetical protein
MPGATCFSSLVFFSETEKYFGLPLLEVEGILVGIEVKSSRTIDENSAVRREKFMWMNSVWKAGIIACRGKKVVPPGKGIGAIPITALLN